MKNTTSIKIPKKYADKLVDVYQDFDGYWAESDYGYYFTDMESHTAHEDTQKDLLRVIRTLAPCSCNECVRELNRRKNATET